jgi:glycerol-3-phosphate responsive antiterminator
MISGLKAALSNSEKQRKIMLVNSDLVNSLKEKTACCGFVKEGITKQ